MSVSFDWSAVDDEALPEILEQSKAFLSDMLTVSLAAEERATTLAGVYGALCVGLLAADATLLILPKFDAAAAWCILATALGNLVACLICVYMSRPYNFFLGGYEPIKLVSGATDKVWMLCYICEDMQRRIDQNKKALKRSATLSTLASIVSAGSIVLSLAAFAIARLFG
jgi:hypothetical protein